MSQTLRRFASLSLASILFATTALYAPTPPETHTLREVKANSLQADPVFDKWIEKLQGGVSPLVLGEAEYQKALKEMDPVSAQMWELKKHATLSSHKATVAAAYEALRSKIDSWKQNAMFPYLAQALLDSGELSADELRQLEKMLMDGGGVSCPRKRLVLRELKAYDRDQIRAEDAKRYLAMIKEFRSLTFQEEALRTLLYRLDVAGSKDIKKELIMAVQPYPRLVNAYPDLFEEKAELLKTSGVRVRGDSAEKLVRAEQCARAQEELSAAIKDDSSRQFLPMVDAVATKIEACWRAKGDRQYTRAHFWETMEPLLKERYAFPGEAMAKRRRGLILWGQDDFEGSRQIFAWLLKESEKEYPAVHAETLYTYARVTENEGKFDDAIEKFRSFIELYPKDEKVNDALSAVIVLSTVVKKPDEALKFALDMIGKESLKNPDDRDGANLPMALYWAGKIYYEKGMKKNAAFFWNRLAQEFYSTFYGAIAHLALEKMNGKRYLLPPVQVPRFDREEMLRDFSPIDRRILERVEQLLATGLKSDAACEINEIPVETAETHHQLAKAIFQYASGDWLAAVKTYQNLPKGYRITLPKGMERILFPRSFGPMVQEYSNRLGVDPHYVNAIIRQESVFNPKAQSPVGARGLMQMMPGTARLEARSLSARYLNPEEAGRIAAAIKDEKNLSDPETNLILGIHHVDRLLQKYKHPVFVLTSYNANPRATERWLNNIDSSDMIVFIERIPYKETRSYVKLVMRNYFYYKRWYEGSKANLPLMEALLPTGMKDESQDVQTARR